MYTLTQKEYSNLKRRLTIAIKSGKSDKIIAEVDRAMDIFMDKGYPDDWSHWQRAWDDAILKKTYQLS